MAVLRLGTRDDGGSVELHESTLLRHAMALGSSGSGKTVFCKVVVEEALSAGIPVICVDPQGDICSLASAAAGELSERAEVVIFTPGSKRGIALNADPLDPASAHLPEAERAGALTRASAMVVELLAFDLDSDDGAGLSAVIDTSLHAMVKAGRPLSLSGLTQYLAQRMRSADADFDRYLDRRKVQTACQRLARLDVGARRELFHEGVPLNVDLLLGRDPRAASARGKARVSVVYLNSLHREEDKAFFIAALVERIYSWMLANPNPELQALFYIDEVAPFIPPVRKPACKEGLSLLFKQARKFGVGCLMATQNPGDVDYRAMAQFGTWSLGRLTTRQDLKKVEPTVKSLAPTRVDAIMGTLPALSPGHFTLLSPDEFDAPVSLSTRWLSTEHETWSEDRIEEYTDREMRDRFRPLIDEAERSREVVAARADEPESVDMHVGKPPPGSARSGEPVALPEAADTGIEEEAEVEDSLLAQLEAAVSSRRSATVGELVPKLDRSESTIRRALTRLCERGTLRSYKEGRTTRYFSVATGRRPDLGMPDEILSVMPTIDEAMARQLGAQRARTRILGFIGQEETLDHVEQLYRMVYRVAFEERVERPVLARLFGPGYDERLGHVYLHPKNLGLVTLTNVRGIEFDDLPQGPASEIRDFDGVADVRPVPPGSIPLVDDDWRDRLAPQRVLAHFQKRFDAKGGDIQPVFVPLWHLYFKPREGGSLRRVTVDALVGKPVRWL